MSLYRRISAVGIAACATAGALCACGQNVQSDPPVVSADEAACAALSGARFGDGTLITSTAHVNTGLTIGTTSVKGSFCRVIAIARPTGDSQIGFETWLPDRSGWNGKFQGVGSGSSAGSIAYSGMKPALEAGYVAMATDNGHVSNLNLPNGTAEQTWALGHPEKIIDFAYRAEHVATLHAKEILQKFYGIGPSKSYFVGCSQGGHHALMEASRYPDDYDGIVAGAPGWNWVNLMAAELWNSEPALQDPTALTPASIALLNSAIVAACDANDGVKDGVVNDPRACHFDPATLQCRPGSSTNCLTPSQVAAATHIYGGTRRSDGSSIFPGYTPGSEPGWAPLYTGKTPGGSGWDFFRYTVFQNPAFDNRNFDFDADFTRAQQATIDGQTVSTIFNATPDLEAFRARGGKLIVYHGWADQQISALNSIAYYDQVTALQGSTTKTDDFMRLFMVPGMQHCTGGPGPQNFGASTGTPPVADAGHDIVQALDQWVSQGTKPASVIASVVANGSVSRSRPLCPYPQVARYNGTGSSDDALNFSCVSP